MSKLPLFYRWWINAWPHRWQLSRQVPEFLRSAPEPFRGEVLELGAGHGWTSREILKTFPQVELTAVDVDIEATRHFSKLEAQYGRRLKVKQANIFQLPFDRDSFDIVVAINMFTHLKPYSIRKAVEESLRVLRPGGLMGLSDRLSFYADSGDQSKEILSVLEQEQCDILTDVGGKPGTIWARKSYPVPPEEVQS